LLPAAPAGVPTARIVTRRREATGAPYPNCPGIGRYETARCGFPKIKITLRALDLSGNSARHTVMSDADIEHHRGLAHIF
jgi:hypothetical protein